MPYAYTEPSPGRYPWQWYWDSCFAAIVNRRFEPGRSRAELESLLAAQRPDGFIGHTIFWGRPVSGFRRAFYNVATRTARQTESIQPPLLAWAWRLAVGDPTADPRIGAQADWLIANRDLEGDGLLWIVQPDESGLDASPKFDPVWGRRSVGRAGFPLLVERNRRLGWDARRIRDRGGPVLCETARQHLLVALAAEPRPALGDAGAGRRASGTRSAASSSTRPSRGPPPRPGHLGEPGAAGPAGPAGGDRQATGRGAPAERGRVPHPGGAALGLGVGAQLRPERQPRPDPPLLARPDLDQLRLDGLARHAPARLPEPRPTALRGGSDRRRRPLRPARVLRPARRHRPRRQGLRLVGPRRRAGRPAPEPDLSLQMGA